MTRPSTARWALIIAAECALLAAISTVAPAVDVAPLVSFVFAFACIAAATLAVSASAPERRIGELAWALLPIAALIAVALLGPRAVNLGGALVVFTSLMAAGSLAGSILGQRIQHAGHLLPVAFVSSLADLWSVLHSAGPSKALVDAPRALAVLALPWPLLGTDEIVPVLGVGDVVFAALYFAVARRHQLSLTRTAIALAAGFAVTMVVVLWLEIPLPVLPALGLAMLVAHPAAWRLPAEDRRQAVVGMAVVGLLFGVLWLVR